MNPNNPTYCYIVEANEKKEKVVPSDVTYMCPRTGNQLRKYQGYWWSHEGGWAYPDIDGIACLRDKHGVLMSHD